MWNYGTRLHKREFKMQQKPATIVVPIQCMGVEILPRVFKLSFFALTGGKGHHRCVKTGVVPTNMWKLYYVLNI